MFRVLLSLVVALALLALHAPAGHAAKKPRPGQKCTHIGKIASVPTGILICVQRKKAKVWVKRNWGVYDPEESWSDTSLEVDESQYELQPWASVYSDIKSRAEARGTGPVLFDIRYDPRIPAERWGSIADIMTVAYGAWSRIAPMSNPVPLLIMDEGSYDWYLSQSALFPDNNCGESWWMRYGTPTSIQSTGAVCWTPAGNPILLQRVGSGVDPDTNALTTAHETVHVAQLVTLGNVKNEMPCWFGEGQAQIYGAALARDYSLVDVDKFRSQQTQTLSAFIASRGGSSPESWTQVLSESEGRGSALCLRNFLGYSMGLLAMERLYADYGEDAILGWMQASRDLGDWKSAFSQRFGLTPSDWYATSAGPYIASELS